MDRSQFVSLCRLKTMRAFALSIILIFIAGCETDSKINPFGSAQLRSVPDSRTFVLDPSTEFSIDLGRGSGMSGLDTLSIDESGIVSAHCISRTPPGTTVFQLTDIEMAEVRTILESTSVLILDREYHADDVFDGSQWIFLVKQGEQKKTVYFNNYFPNEILCFADRLDKLLDLDSPKREWKQYEKNSVADRLWDAIKE